MAEASFKNMSLFTHAGERKYLSQRERLRFYDALDVLPDPKDRMFCELIYWTGCRISEALDLPALRVDIDEDTVVFRTLKKRGKLKGRHFRPVPVPPDFMVRLAEVHELHRVKSRPDGGVAKRLWTFSRTTGWLRIKTVMDAAGLSGISACAKGLRHAYGVHAVVSEVPVPSLQRWLGHASLETTSIYIDAAGFEDRKIARRMWRELAA